MPTKQKSNKSIAPFSGTSYVNDRFVYTETGEPVFRVTPLIAVYRDTLTPERTFSPDDALKLIDKYYKKKHSECVAYIAEKRLIVTKRKPSDKTPFRTWVAYTEIVDIRRGVKKLDAFVMSINSQQTGKRYYELYRCKSKEEAGKFEDLVRRALEQPDGILRGNDLQTDSSFGHADDPKQPRNLLHHSFTPSLHTLKEEELAEREAESVYQPASPPTPHGLGQPSVYENVGYPERNQVEVRANEPVSAQAPGLVPGYDGGNAANDLEYPSKKTPVTVSTSPSGHPTSYQPRVLSQNVHKSNYIPDSLISNHRLSAMPNTTEDPSMRPSRSIVLAHPTAYTGYSSPTLVRTNRFSTPETNQYGLRSSSHYGNRYEQSFSVRKSNEIKALPGVTYLKFDPKHGFQPSDTGPVYIYSLGGNTQLVNKNHF